MADRPKLHRLRRHAETLGALDLYSRFSELRGRPMADAERLRTATKIFEQGVRTSVDSASRMQGKHVEAMFAALVAALGNVDLLKVEDEGDCYVRDPVSVPDYRVVTRQGRQLLVEVKSVGPVRSKPRFRLRAQDMDGLQSYAALTGAELVFALFWSNGNLWTLVSPRRFRLDGTRYEIDIASAAAGTEMVDLGDMLVSTVPPLELAVTLDAPIPNDEARGDLKLSVATIELMAGGRLLEDEYEEQLALFLMFNGDWEVTEDHEEVDGMTHRMRFVARPSEGVPREQRFAGVGFLSQMFSRDYLARTTRDGAVLDFHAESDPEYLGSLIPDDYEGTGLQLWRFRLSPKPD